MPARNWFTSVRVCDDCFSKDNNSNETSAEIIEREDVSVRKVSEHVVSTLNAFGTVLTYSKCKYLYFNFISYILSYNK